MQVARVAAMLFSKTVHLFKALPDICLTDSIFLWLHLGACLEARCRCRHPFGPNQSSAGEERASQETTTADEEEQHRKSGEVFPCQPGI